MEVTAPQVVSAIINAYNLCNEWDGLMTSQVQMAGLNNANPAIVTAFNTILTDYTAVKSGWTSAAQFHAACTTFGTDWAAGQTGALGAAIAADHVLGLWQIQASALVAQFASVVSLFTTVAGFTF